MQCVKQPAGQVAKILLGLLVISFAIWGVSGELGGIGANTLARVGDQEVTALEFDSALRQRIEQLSRQSGAPITMEQANAVGVSQQVLGELLSTAALDDQAADYNLGVSDDKLAARILNDPVFQGPDGQFDRERFRLILQNAGLREDNYVSTFRRSIAREQLAEAIAGRYQDAPTDGRGLLSLSGRDAHPFRCDGRCGGDRSGRRADPGGAAGILRRERRRLPRARIPQARRDRAQARCARRPGFRHRRGCRRRI